MYSLRLSPEQLEIRDMLREFVAAEILPVTRHPDYLEQEDRRVPAALLEQLSKLGLRALCLSEEAGGSAGDTLTACIALEELAVGDADLAAVVAQTLALAPALFDKAMSAEQRSRFLPAFLDDSRYHLALAAREASEDRDFEWRYYRPFDRVARYATTARRDRSGDWIVNGAKTLVLNAPLARLFAVQVATDRDGVTTLLVPRDAPGLTVKEHVRSASGTAEDGEPLCAWYHGARGDVIFDNTRVPAANLVGEEGASPLQKEAAWLGRGLPFAEAIALGVGRAAYESAVDYAKIRVQGGKPIIEHQSIGTLLANVAIKLEAARSVVWQAAWAADHPEAVAERSLSPLPLQTMARVFASETVYQAVREAAEVFGGMGVMRDMPIQTNDRDALMLLYGDPSNSVAKLRIAEALAGYERRSRGWLSR
jgi:alkylation response protein AidB-like acyl-CoA dehydrogenase